ncbi:hypothetical protein Ocin01_03673 [Orchesella cincta]|uniref:Uncharacterized protein n=1 Tax=Orchesella cincta TaxID=48709 RepID=A0A1D2NCQ4_ORCCI|nr:hypothetical protein Ocin01_03673 [Orchesella cincta]
MGKARRFPTLFGKKEKEAKPRSKSILIEEEAHTRKPYFGILSFFNFFQKRKLQKEEFEKIYIIKSKRKRIPIRFPWQASEREEFIAKREDAARNPDVYKAAGKLMRIKFPEKHTASKVGVGYPSRGLVYANLGIVRGTQEREVLTRTSSGTPLLFKPLETKIPGPIPDNVFTEYCTRMGIGVYDGEPAEDERPSQTLDLTAFDLYWEDIRIERDVIIRELRYMPLKAKVELTHLAVFEKSMYHLARSCYYSPHYSHKKCEDILQIFIWLLNRSNLPLVFHIKVMQCLSLILYSSPVFKKELVNIGGVRILVRVMQLGMSYCGLQASWAVYVLTMAAIGSPDIIEELRKIKDIDERVGEMTFHMFWYHWPTNFGLILQSILFGPGGVANYLDAFEFL